MPNKMSPPDHIFVSPTRSWMGTGTVGITQRQTLRMTIVNVGDEHIPINAMLSANPNVLHDAKTTLRPGKMWAFDAVGKSFAKHFNKKPRLQVRGVVSSSRPTFLASLEIVDNKTHETRVVLPFQKPIGNYILASPLPWRMGTGTVGLTPKQTLRMTVVNVGDEPILVNGAMSTNPNVLHDAKTSLRPGKMWTFDAVGKSFAKHFHKKPRLQVRGVVSSSRPTFLASLEIVDNKTHETRAVLPFQKINGMD